MCTRRVSNLHTLLLRPWLLVLVVVVVLVLVVVQLQGHNTWVVI